MASVKDCRHALVRNNNLNLVFGELTECLALVGVFHLYLHVADGVACADRASL